MVQRENSPISLKEVIRAKEVVYGRMRPSNLLHAAGLSRLLGMELSIKYENHNPGASFKVRGGINLVHHLQQDGVPGLVTFSTGNHGISLACSGAWAGVPVVVVVPEGNKPVKNRRIVEAGAELVEGGNTFEEASLLVDELAASRGLAQVHPANEPHLINGVGTGFLEIIEELPDLDALIVPIGAGSEAAAAVTVCKAINPAIEIYAVQASCSPAAHRSWQAGRLCTASNESGAGGFATGQAYELHFSIYHDQLSDFVLLSEEEISQGIALFAHHCCNLVEGAGAAPLMAAIRLRQRLQGKKVVIQCSGGNGSADEIQEAFERPEFVAGYTG